MKNHTRNARLMTATSVVALLGGFVVSPTNAQGTSSNLASKTICSSGKVPGYVSTGCVDDTPASGHKKNSAAVKGAKREPITAIVGRGVPTVNIDTTIKK